jgi:hypothetical protein
MRAFADGFVSLLLPFYLTLLGFSAFEVGVVVTVTLVGSGLLTLAMGLVAHRYGGQRLLLIGAGLMCVTGILLTLAQDFWPLLVVAFVGTLTPTPSDATLFSPLEHALLSRSVPAPSRTALFARYSVVGSLVMAFGAQASALPSVVATSGALDLKSALQGMFLLYAVIGAASFVVYRRLSHHAASRETPASGALGKSRSRVYKLACLFSLDSFGGGFAVQSLLALWLLQRFDLSIVAAASIFFLDRPAHRALATRLARDRVAIRPRQHDGLYPHPGQSLPRTRAVHAEPVAGNALPLPAQPPLQHGRAGTQLVRDGRRHAGRASGRGQHHRRPAQSRERRESGDRGLSPRHLRVRLAAGDRGRSEDHLRPAAAHDVQACQTA